MEKLDAPIIVTHTYNCKASVLWKAITEPERMRKWYFDNITDFKAQVGFNTTFPISTPTQTFTHNWTITKVIPNVHLEYSWNYQEFNGDGYVTFVLVEGGATTTLTFTSTLTKAYPSDIPEFKRESGVGGWNYLLKTNLVAYIDDVSNG